MVGGVNGPQAPHNPPRRLEAVLPPVFRSLACPGGWCRPPIRAPGSLSLSRLAAFGCLAGSQHGPHGPDHGATATAWGRAGRGHLSELAIFESSRAFSRIRCENQRGKEATRFRSQLHRARVVHTRGSIIGRVREGEAGGRSSSRITRATLESGQSAQSYPPTTSHHTVLDHTGTLTCRFEGVWKIWGDGRLDTRTAREYPSSRLMFRGRNDGDILSLAAGGVQAL